MLCKVALFAAGVLLVGISSSRADEAVLDQLYGNGVHYYFGSDYSRAYDSLSAAIRGGSKDPRAYYFRGLAEMRLGREPDATADFTKGAELESADANGRYFVGQSLERIQGPTRAALEQYRENARAVALERSVHNQQSVFVDRQGAESQVLRRSVPPVEMTPAPPPDQAVAKPAAPPAKARPQPPVVANEKAAVEKPADAAADPFAPAPAGNPAAEPASGTAPPDKAPPDKAPPDKAPADQAPGDDPFKAPPAKAPAPPVEKPAAPAEKPDESNDPFKGGAKPAEKSDAAPASKAASADMPVKPQPGAVRGIFKALVGGMPGGNSTSPAPATAAPSPPPGATATAPQKTPAPAAGASDDPFATAPSVAPKPPVPPADAPPAATAPKDSAPPATSSPAAKKVDPFADEPPAKGPDAKPADAPPAAKSPAPADKSAPEMKKDEDPFKN